MTIGIDELVIDMPKRCITQQKCPIMLETGMSKSLPEILPIFFLLPQLIASKKTDKAVCVLMVLCRDSETYQE
jgi:hypothetical protein